ncbi:MAG: DUF4124 domain-containing protein [Pseudomonadota bacterium]
MRALAMAAVLALAATMAAAQPGYRWKDTQGKTHYGDVPPAGVNAEAVVDDQAFPRNPEACPTIRCQLDRMQQSRKLENEAEAADPRRQPRAAAPSPGYGATGRGLPFDVYVNLRRGMTEGEILTRAGPPDFQSSDGVDEQSIVLGELNRNEGPRAGRGFSSVKILRSNFIKTYTYLPNAGDPFTTVITFRGGVVEDLQRIRRF